MYIHVRVIVYVIAIEGLKKVAPFLTTIKKACSRVFFIHAYGTFPNTAEVTFHYRRVLSLYVHIHIYEPFCLCMQGWATDSRKILLLDDELDEVLDFGGDRY